MAYFLYGFKGLIGLFAAYVVFRLFTYCCFKSYFEAKYDYLMRIMHKQKGGK